MLDDRVLRFRQDITKRTPIQRVQIGQDRQTSDDFRNQAKRFQVGWCNVCQQIVAIHLRRVFVCGVSYYTCIQTLGDFLLYSVESATTYKQDIFRIHGNHFLLRMLAPTLRGYVHDGTFQELQQALLHTFTAYITGNGRIIALTGDLIYFIDKYDTTLCRFDIIIGSLQQTGQNAFYILPYITGFCQDRRIYNGKRDMEQFGDRTGK